MQTSQNCSPEYFKSSYLHDDFFVFIVHDLSNCAVDGKGAAADPLDACCDFYPGDSGEISDRQEQEQKSKRSEDHLGDAVVLQCADKHECGEDAP